MAKKKVAPKKKVARKTKVTGKGPMDFCTIKNHLKAYSVRARRATTINHAFASAIVPFDRYDAETIARVKEAMRKFDQDLNDLHCVYCVDRKTPAATWDHLVGLVKNKEPHGYGHQVGNLVPCCKSCNEKKGGKDWEDFVDQNSSDPTKKKRLKRQLKEHLKQFAVKIDLGILKRECPKEYGAYEALKSIIIMVMDEADKLAPVIEHHLNKQSRGDARRAR